MNTMILHSDLNCFYASVECLLNPTLRGKPVAVCGSSSARRGIILAKSQEAKLCGVKAGLAIWEAKRLCPELITVEARQDVYLYYARMVREIYTRVTSFVEPYGMDEAWLDVTGQSGPLLADQLRKMIRSECGLTASVGVADNKIYAKLGSDYKKPDATTVFLGEAVRSIVYRLPVSDLLFVGPATAQRLNSYHILSIGDLAQADPLFLKAAFGKNGLLLSHYARGDDYDPVKRFGEFDEVKSIGHSTTLPHDLTTMEEVKRILLLLCESVSERLRKHELEARCVSVWLRRNDMQDSIRQMTLSSPTALTMELYERSSELISYLFNPHFFRARHIGIRAIGMRTSQLSSSVGEAQLTMDCTAEIRERRKLTDRTIDDIRARYGHYAIGRASLIGSGTKPVLPVQPESEYHDGTLPQSSAALSS